MVGLLILPSALLVPFQFSVREHHAGSGSSRSRRRCSPPSAFAMVGPVLQAVVPYRLRGMGTAMSTLYIFFIGGFMGGLVSGFLTDAIGVRGTVIVLGVPSAIIGGALLMNGARYIRNDLSLVVEELLEEKDEHEKRFVAKRRHPPPAARQHRLLVRPGAGALRRRLRGAQGRDARAARHERRGQVDGAARRSAVSRFPSAAWCASTARTSRTSSPEQRAKYLSIMQLPGGHGVFGNLTVEQNLAVSARLNADGPQPGPAARRGRLRAVPRARRPPQADRVAACRAASSRWSRWHGC